MKISCGIDIERISRFEKYGEKDRERLLKFFSPSELDYCFCKKTYANSLCARFCAKEAVIKALCSHGLPKPFLNQIEVVMEGEVPKIKLSKNYPAQNINISLSLSHCEDYACANAVVYEN